MLVVCAPTPLYTPRATSPTVSSLAVSSVPPTPTAPSKKQTAKRARCCCKNATVHTRLLLPWGRLRITTMCVIRVYTNVTAVHSIRGCHGCTSSRGVSLPAAAAPVNSNIQLLPRQRCNLSPPGGHRAAAVVVVGIAAGINDVALIIIGGPLPISEGAPTGWNSVHAAASGRIAVGGKRGKRGCNRGAWRSRTQRQERQRRMLFVAAGASKPTAVPQKLRGWLCSAVHSVAESSSAAAVQTAAAAVKAILHEYRVKLLARRRMLQLLLLMIQGLGLLMPR